MERYDIVIAGGGVGGSVAAKFAAMGGLRTLFIEKCRTPRHKPCSGIQFPYFDKILGEKIPAERLCNVPITRVEMHFPDGTTTSAPFSALNYMRNVFDEWLNIRAQEEGAEFRDECEFVDFEEADDGCVVTIAPRGKELEKVAARYLIDATGLSSLPIRRKLRPHDFEKASSGGGINYYRNFHRNWEITPQLDGARVRQPAMFIAGEQDGVIGGATQEQLVAAMGAVIADLRGVHLIPDTGHWVQQERPAEVNALLLAFLASLDPQPG